MSVETFTPGTAPQNMPGLPSRMTTCRTRLPAWLASDHEPPGALQAPRSQIPRTPCTAPGPGMLSSPAAPRHPQSSFKVHCGSQGPAPRREEGPGACPHRPHLAPRTGTARPLTTEWPWGAAAACVSHTHSRLRTHLACPPDASGSPGRSTTLPSCLVSPQSVCRKRS